MVGQWVRRVQQFIGVIVLLLMMSVALSKTQSIVLSIDPAAPWAMDFQARLNQSVSLNTFTLTQPDRVVVDFKGVQGPVRFTQPTRKPSAIKAVRFARNSSTTFRVVFDMNESVTALIKPSTSATVHTVMITPQTTRLAQSTTPVTDTPHSVVVSSPSSPVAVVPVTVKASARAKDIIIMIDPGHGGKDPGATGVNGVHEKTVVLAISKKIVQMINQQPGYRAYLTRSDDRYLTLRQRIAIARQKKADIFVAIHADAFSNKRAKGASVFALSTRGATSEAARWLAQKENESELVGGLSLSDKTHLLKSVLLSLSQTATIRSSLVVGQDILASLNRVTTLHHLTVEQAAFVVLKSPDIPSLLIETGFLSNPTEAKRLASSSYQGQIARAIEKGLVSYFNKQPPRGTWVAEKKASKGPYHLSYTVIRGDTLSGISSRYNITMSALMSENNLRNRELRVGQVLAIPVV